MDAFKAEELKVERGAKTILTLSGEVVAEVPNPGFILKLLQYSPCLFDYALRRLEYLQRKEKIYELPELTEYTRLSHLVRTIEGKRVDIREKVEAFEQLQYDQDRLQEPDRFRTGVLFLMLTLLPAIIGMVFPKAFATFCVFCSFIYPGIGWLWFRKQFRQKH